MNQLYRDNMQKLRSSRYNKKSGGKFSKSNSYKEYSGKLRAPELTFQEKRKLRDAIKERNRKMRMRTIVALILGSLLLVLAIGWLAQSLQTTKFTVQNTKDDLVIYQKQEYARYMSYGDEYLNKSQWYNAAFEYRTFLTFNPESEDALYRLTFALMRLCETEQRGCEEAEKRLEALGQTSYNPADIEELTLRWEGLNQQITQP